jgi:hypothetical protein
MPPRPDMTDKLIHFTSGDSHEDAFGNLCSIIEDRHIFGHNHKIKGLFTCVCFTEAPLEALSRGLVNYQNFSRYRPFGIIYDKSFVYSQGGRPVIYQPDDEFDALSESSRWRHMRYEPNANPPIDFTWEREWRVQTSQIPVQPHIAGIVVPSQEWEIRLRDSHSEQQDHLVYMYSQIMDRSIAEQYREGFPWRFYCIE